MKQFVILLSLFISFVCNSQTKLISHKSHSGSAETFALAIENDLFDIEDSNFGYIIRTENFVKLDSVIYISENKVVRVSSEYTQRYKNSNKQKCSADELTKIKKDTIIIKPKSTKKGLTVKDVKANLDSLKIYNNNLNETIYKGFDKKSKRQKKKKNLFFPIIPNFSNIPNSFFFIVILSLLSVLVYFISLSFKFRKLNLSN